MTDVTAIAGEIYAETRGRVTELVSGLSDEDASRIVPATPAWTVKDVIAHMAGNVDCIVTGRLEGVASDEWTDAQIRERKDRSLAEVLAEWNEKAPQVEGMVSGGPEPMIRMLLADVATHEQDLRGALARPGARDSRGFVLSFESYLLGLGRRIEDGGLPGLRVLAGGEDRVAGRDPAGVTLTADRFELTRAMAGRRSTAQVRAFRWDGDPGPYVETLTPFSLRGDDLVE